MTLQEKLQAALRGKYALLATNFYNFETLQAVMLAARETGKPLILQLTRSSIEYMGLQQALNMARTAAKLHAVEAWIHLDHGDSFELAKDCIEAGFDSVMIDASEAPFEQNVKLTKAVVKLAKEYGVCVEAELGYVAKLGQQREKRGFTEPSEARCFVEETGVDSLAVAIGSAHGFYKETPSLDLERLSGISSAVSIPLVLHGGSGIPDAMIRDAVARGICKVNLATEIKNAFIKKIRLDMAESDEIDLRKLFAPAISTVTKLVMDKLNVVS